MKPMRVLLLSHAYAIPIAREKAENLSAFRDLDLTLFFPSRWREGSREYRLRGVEPEGVPCPVRTGRVLFSGHIGGYLYLTGLVRALRETRPDLVHLEEEPWSLAAAQVLLLRTLLRQRFKLVLFTWENQRRRFRLPRRLIERCVLRRVDLAIAGGEGARGRLFEQGVSRERVAVLPQFGLDPRRFSAGSRPRAGEGPFTIGYVGRLVWAKGVDLLVRAASRLGGEWQLLVVGEGPARKELIALAESLGVMGRVAFIGGVDHGEVPRYLRQLDVLVLPSRTTPQWAEQFGHVLIEAMSTEVPVVASKSGAIPEVVGDAGLLFPEGDVPALTKALADLRDDPGWAEELGVRGRRRVLERFSWERIARRTFELYRSLLNDDVPAAKALPPEPRGRDAAGGNRP
ncbi:MAG: glycosyltransferase [Nitrospinota bacterium]